MRRLLTVLLLACAGLGISPPALAHNVLASSDPKDGATLSSSPERITLVFDQPVRRGYAQIGVTGADGSSWADGAATVAAERVSVKVGPLPAGGAYVVGYRILSADGHPVTGKITFSLAPAKASALPTDPTQADPAQADPAQADPAQADPAQADPAQADPARADPAQADPAQGDPTQADPAQGDPAQGDPARQDVGAEAADAAEAAANGGAGMAVVWIVGALLILAVGTAVALRRAAPGPDGAPPTREPGGAPDQNDTAPGRDTAPVPDTAPAHDTPPVPDTAPAHGTPPALDTAPSRDTASAHDTPPVRDTDGAPVRGASGPAPVGVATTDQEGPA
ncbi:copper resistance protein CopC [Nonomuraea sp. NPDC048916]|uniref:copper resistance protein CopC n=1 Tax=Nonomuraea sp. NPDC048916 TaxID=3154232 RepID=UPI0033C2DE67